MVSAPRIIIYAGAAVALAVGMLAYTRLEEEHEEAGIVAGDLAKVLIAVAVLAVVAIVSLAYLLRKPPEEAV